MEEQELARFNAALEELLRGLPFPLVVTRLMLLAAFLVEELDGEGKDGAGLVERWVRYYERARGVGDDYDRDR